MLIKQRSLLVKLKKIKINYSIAHLRAITNLNQKQYNKPRTVSRPVVKGKRKIIKKKFWVTPKKWKTWSITKRKKFKKKIYYPSKKFYHSFYQSVLHSILLPIIVFKSLQPVLLSKGVLYFQYMRYTNFLFVKKSYIFKNNKSNDVICLNKQNYIKNIIRYRYGWYLTNNKSKEKLARKKLKKWFSKFRKIKKNFFFIKLQSNYFYNLTGYNKNQFINRWIKFRNLNNSHWGLNSVVHKFSQSLLLSPLSIILFTGLVPSQSVAKLLIQIGGFIVNGIVTSNLYIIKPQDIIQIIPYIFNYLRALYKYHQWHKIKINFSNISFFEVHWSLLMFTLVRWPYKYELIAPSFLSERWIRYYIRQIPVKNKNLTR